MPETINQGLPGILTVLYIIMILIISFPIVSGRYLPRKGLMMEKLEEHPRISTRLKDLLGNLWFRGMLYLSVVILISIPFFLQDSVPEKLWPQVIIGIALVVIILLPVSLRYTFSDRLWVGVLLCLFSGPVGHLYLSRGLKYFIGISALAYIIFRLLDDPMHAALITTIVSIGIMIERFLLKRQLE
jgi:hypothetical protein